MALFFVNKAARNQMFLKSKKYVNVFQKLTNKGNFKLDFLVILNSCLYLISILEVLYDVNNFKLGISKLYT